MLLSLLLLLLDHVLLCHVLLELGIDCNGLVTVSSRSKTRKVLGTNGGATYTASAAAGTFALDLGSDVVERVHLVHQVHQFLAAFPSKHQVARPEGHQGQIHPYAFAVAYLVDLVVKDDLEPLDVQPYLDVAEDFPGGESMAEA